MVELNVHAVLLDVVITPTHTHYTTTDQFFIHSRLGDFRVLSTLESNKAKFPGASFDKRFIFNDFSKFRKNCSKIRSVNSAVEITNK